MNNEAKYYKSEYENLRRKKNKEIEKLKQQNHMFFVKTLKFFKLMGIDERIAIEYYAKL